jgi:hypothetical protein
LSKSLERKLEDLRTLETELWSRHIEDQAYLRETYGARGYDSRVPSTYSRAAEALGQLLDGVEALLGECVDAEATAYATGQPCEESATVAIGLVKDTLNEYLADDED